MARLERKVLLGLLFGVAVYAGLAVWGDVSAVKDELLGFEWWWFGAALAMSLGNYALRFAKWQYYLSLVRIRLPARESLLVFVSGFVLTVTPGKIGEVLKSYLLKRSRGHPVAVTAPIVVAERLTDLLSLIVLALIGIAAYAYGTSALLVSSAIVLVGLLLVSNAAAMNVAIAVFERVPVAGAKLAPRLRVAYDSMRVLIAPRALLFATVLSVLGWGLECLAFYWIVGAFSGAQPALLAAMFLYAFTTVLGALSFLPGGIGVTESSMSVGLVELGLLPAEPAAVAATYLIRLATLWFAVALGVIAFAYYRRRYLAAA